MGAASLVLGILSLVIAVFGGSFGISWIGTIFAIIGIILGAKAKKIPEQAGLGKGGFICSIIGLILSLLVFIACVACLGGLAALGATAGGLEALM